MTTNRSRARLVALVSLVLETAIAFATLGLIILSAPIILILAAQTARFAAATGWRGFQFSEFLEVIGLDPNAAAKLYPGVGNIVDWPAALVLGTPALALLALIALLSRANRRQRARIARLQQAALIEDIAKKLEAK